MCTRTRTDTHRAEVTRNVHQQQDETTHRCQLKMALAALLMTTQGKRERKRGAACLQSHPDSAWQKDVLLH